jgi:thiamine-monophosphate kinase
MKKRSRKHLNELTLIDLIRQRSSYRDDNQVALGIGDDCGILRPAKGCEILVTTDFSLEGRHFLRDRHPAQSVGHRCLTRGLSDLAAMGASPMAAFLSLALPSRMLSTESGLRWVDRFFAGFHRLGNLYKVTLAGGDTSESPTGLILADIVLVGSAPRGRSLRRSGGRAGDILYVTGALGGASAELAHVLAGRRLSRLTEIEGHPHLFPQPRLTIGKELVRRQLATAALDISDGLSTDLAHLCEASNLHAELDQSTLPIHPLARRLPPEQALQAALHGGEDYELLFAAPPSVRIPKAIAGVPLTRIGMLKAATPKQPLITLLEPDGRRRPLEPEGWRHFSAHRKPSR